MSASEPTVATSPEVRPPARAAAPHGALATAALVALVLLAAGLRFHGLGFGHPELLQVDEPFEMDRALRLGTGDYHWRRAGKGGLYLLEFVMLGASYATLRFAGAAPTPDAFARFYMEHEATFYVAGRAISATLGVASVAILARLAARRAGPAAGLLAGLALALSPLHVEESHYATVDATFLFTLMLAWPFVFAAADGAPRRTLLAAGALSGVAVAAKLPALVMVLPVALAAWTGRHGRRRDRAGALRDAVAALALLLVTAIAFEPGYLMLGYRWQLKLEAIFSPAPAAPAATGAALSAGGPAAAATSAGLPAPDGAWELAAYYGRGLVEDLGWPLVVLAAGGLVAGIARRRAGTLVSLAFLIPYLAVLCVANADFRYLRYLLPALPLLHLAAARAAVEGYRWFTARVPSLGRPALAAAALAVVFAQPAAEATRTAAGFGLPSTRIAAQRWIEARVPPGSAILAPGHPEHRGFQIVPLLQTDEMMDELIAASREEYPGKARYMALRRDVTAASPRPRYRVRYVRLSDRWPTYAEARRDGIGWIVLYLARFTTGGELSHERAEPYKQVFLRELRADPGAREVARFAPGDRLTGPEIAIYHVAGNGAAAGRD